MTLGAGAVAIVDSSIDRNSNDPRPVLIVTGLVQEARIAAGPGMIVICSSSDPRQLRALLATLDSTTFRGVISFGVAGGHAQCHAESAVERAVHLVALDVAGALQPVEDDGAGPAPLGGSCPGSGRPR